MKPNKSDKPYCYHADFIVRLSPFEHSTSEYADEFYVLMLKSVDTIKAKHHYIGTRYKFQPEDYYEKKTQDTFRFSATDPERLDQIINNVKIMGEEADLLDKLQYKIIYHKSFVYDKDYPDHYII